MGSSQSTTTVAASLGGGGDDPGFGCVAAKVSWLASARKNKEKSKEFVVSARGALLYGLNADARPMQSVLVDQTKSRVMEVPLADSRANQLFIAAFEGKFWAAPTPEIFSRHSGTCLIIGDRKGSMRSAYKLQLGDCIRLGSVGLVVSEMYRPYTTGYESLSKEHLQFIREEALCLDAKEEALLANEEGHRDTECGAPPSVVDGDGSGMAAEAAAAANAEGEEGPGEEAPNKVCYMCYETTDDEENPLIAPCNCKGDTRYVHMECLQRWHQSSVVEEANVIRTTGAGATACKICGRAYKTLVRVGDKKVTLLQARHDGPFVSLIVVTKHDTNPTLFNTRFQLNYGRIIDGMEGAVTSLTIGRSSSCDMVLDYRTVSTQHAQIYMDGRNFCLNDLESSNGTMVYVHEPVPLPFHRTVRFRMGRSTISLNPKRTWKNRLTSLRRRTPYTAPGITWRLLEDVATNPDFAAAHDTNSLISKDFTELSPNSRGERPLSLSSDDHGHGTAGDGSVQETKATEQQDTADAMSAASTAASTNATGAAVAATGSEATFDGDASAPAGGNASASASSSSSASSGSGASAHSTTRRGPASAVSVVGKPERPHPGDDRKPSAGAAAGGGTGTGTAAPSTASDGGASEEKYAQGGDSLGVTEASPNAVIRSGTNRTTSQELDARRNYFEAFKHTRSGLRDFLDNQDVEGEDGEGETGSDGKPASLGAMLEEGDSQGVGADPVPGEAVAAGGSVGAGLSARAGNRREGGEAVPPTEILSPGYEKPGTEDEADRRSGDDEEDAGSDLQHEDGERPSSMSADEEQPHLLSAASEFMSCHGEDDLSPTDRAPRSDLSGKRVSGPALPEAQHSRDRSDAQEHEDAIAR